MYEAADRKVLHTQCLRSAAFHQTGKTRLADFNWETIGFPNPSSSCKRGLSTAPLLKFISKAKTPASKPKFALAKAVGRTAYLIKKCFALFC